MGSNRLSIVLPVLAFLLTLPFCCPIYSSYEVPAKQCEVAHVAPIAQVASQLKPLAKVLLCSCASRASRVSLPLVRVAASTSFLSCECVSLPLLVLLARCECSRGSGGVGGS
jgi:hypothetical protein